MAAQAYKDQLMQAYTRTRDKTQGLCQALTIEDYVIQSIPDVSPPKWHLAHTTWFFETFILMPQLAGYEAFNPLFQYLFNSYYHGVGKPFPREQRGLLSRPTVANVLNYRKQVDERLLELLHNANENQYQQLQPLVTLGIHHEQQHQELLLMDIKHNLSFDPNYPSYQAAPSKIISYQIKPLEFIAIEGGNVSIGHQGEVFSFDNELPRHQHYLHPYQLATRLITNAEYLEFIAAGGYENPKWWLSDGWDCVLKNHWQAPLYWQKNDDKWQHFTLLGLQDINPNEPVVHVSYYEADAYARWRGYRLPLEAEWEHFVNTQAIKITDGHFLESEIYHPTSINSNTTQPQQFFGSVWEWTASPYIPYPGFKPLSGALGEYNGKFMSNQMVLRGGCCITPQSHIRASYRNFFQPDKRWQFSGIRLAADGMRG